jgi:Flavin reductase like domain
VVSTGAGGGGVAAAVAQTAAQTVAAFDSAVFRQVIGNFMSGVVVISTQYDGVDYGVSVSAIASLSLAPPLLLVCPNVNSGTQEAVRRTDRFGVNILAEHQSEVADRFARPGPDKFIDVAVRTGRSGRSDRNAAGISHIPNGGHVDVREVRDLVEGPAGRGYAASPSGLVDGASAVRRPAVSPRQPCAPNAHG